MRAFSNFARTFAQNPSFAQLYQFSVLVVTGLLVLIQMRGLWKLNKYACFPLLSSQGGDSGLDRVHLVSAPNLAPESSYPKKPKTLRVLMRSNLSFAQRSGFCGIVDLKVIRANARPEKVVHSSCKIQSCRSWI